MNGDVTLWLSERLVAASLQGAAIIVLVWLVCRAGANIPASLRAALWWLAALKLVLALLPVPAVTIPILPAALDWTTDSAASQATPQAGPVGTNPDTVLPGLPPTGPRALPPDAEGMSWLQTAVLVWIGVVVLQVARLLAAFRELRGVVRRAVPHADDEGTVARMAFLLGLPRAPQVRTSNEIDAPQVAGVWRPVVLVPAGAAAALSEDERAMTLCHELMHIRRHDLALGWVPALAERLFFFHPLARLAAREYLTSRESACDAAVVRALQVSPTDYGRMLVRLGIVGSVPALTAGGSSPSLSSLKRRLEMLQHAASSEPSRRSTWLIAIAGCALIPLQLVAGPPADRQSPPAASAPAASDVAAPEVPPALPAETTAARTVERAGQPRLESAPAQVRPVEEAATRDARAAIEEAQRVLSELVQRHHTEALGEQTAELAGRLEAERASQHEAIVRSMQAAAEAASQRARDLLSSAADDDERARERNEAIQQQIRELSARARSRIEQEIARRQGTDSFDWQIEALKRQLEMLTQRLDELVAQQEQLAVAQRRLSDQADLMRRLSEDADRLRQALDAK
jgi:beta-lactamase regulating signal transducer with metallopeptidase domain